MQKRRKQQLAKKANIGKRKLTLRITTIKQTDIGVNARQRTR